MPAKKKWSEKEAEEFADIINKDISRLSGMLHIPKKEIRFMGETKKGERRYKLKPLIHPVLVTDKSIVSEVK